MPEPASPDPYRTLGVPPDASAADIRAAYRQKIQTAHPDHGGSEDRFRRVQAAYEVLGDEDARAEYDQARAGATPSPVRRVATPAYAAPSGPAPSSWFIGLAVGIGVVIIAAVILVVALGQSGPSTSSQRATGASATITSTTIAAGSPASRATSLDAWQRAITPKLEAIVANNQDVGAALSTNRGAVDADALHQACQVRRQLLDDLEATVASPQPDVASATTRFISSERRAVSACLSSPPDIKTLGTWGERAQPDLATVARAASNG